MTPRPIQHFADSTLIRLIEMGKDRAILTFRVEKIRPEIPAREGKEIHVDLDRKEVMESFGFSPWTEANVSGIVGSQRMVAFTSIMEDGKLLIEDFSICGRIYTLKEPSAPLQEGDPKQTTIPGMEQPKKEVDTSCAYCETGKALAVGQECGHCGRHRIGEDEVVIVNGDGTAQPDPQATE